MVTLGSAARGPREPIQENSSALQIRSVDGSGLLPLSFAQERLWLLEQLGLAGTAYNVSAAISLRGWLHLTILEKSFAELERRHGSLRTRFASNDGNPVQVIDPPRTLRLEVIDLGILAEPERARALQQQMREVSERRYSLLEGPLFRTRLVRLAAEEHVLLIGLHHIISDASSRTMLIRELWALYEAYAAGGTSPLPEPAIQYSDYAVRQRAWLQGAVLEKQLSYWRNRLAGAPAILELPTDRPRPAVPSFKGARIAVTVPSVVSCGLAALAREAGATLHIALLAAFQVLLARWSDRDDIVVGVTIAGRQRGEAEQLIGLLANALVIRTDLSGDPSFRSLLKRVKVVVLGAQAHQDLPFEKLVDALRPARDLSRHPLFQVGFDLQHAEVARLEVAGLQLSRLDGEHASVKLDLSLQFQEGESALAGSVEYATDLFDRSTIARLVDHFGILLDGIVAAPNTRLSRLPLQSQAERRRLVDEWNVTAADRPHFCLHDLFAQQARCTPDAVAVVYEDHHLSYGALERSANRLAHHLRELGVHPEVVVGLCVGRSAEMVVGLLGILKAGGAYLPLDPSYPRSRLTYMLADAGAPVIVTEAKYESQLGDGTRQLVKLDTDWPSIAGYPAAVPVTIVDPANLAYVIYTSGSTGQPKGIGLHHSAVALCGWARQLFSKDDLEGAVASTSICFDLSVFELFVPLILGGTVILVDNAMRLHTQRRRATLLNMVPSAIAALLRLDAIPASVRTVNIAGEPLQASLVQELYRRTEVKHVYNLYGPSEDTTYSTWCEVNEDAERITIGRPLSGRTAYVLNRYLDLVPVGIAGELCLGGSGLARCYFDRAAPTAERFIPNPFAIGERLYRTGDLVRRRGCGDLEYLARLDHQVKLRGYRIELGEIETSLRAHPAVEEAVVIAREDTPGQKQLVAYVVGAKDSLDQKDLQSYLRRRLPEYMVPSAVVLLERVPLTSNGKLDRAALPPPAVSVDGRGEPSEPRTSTEVILSKIWRDLLKVDHLGIYDSFFEVGGNSLMGQRVIARARETFGIDLPLRALFEEPSVCALSARIDAVRREFLASGVVYR